MGLRDDPDGPRDTADPLHEARGRTDPARGGRYLAGKLAAGWGRGGIGLGKPRFLLPVISRLRRHAPGARDRRGLISAAAAFRRDRGRRTGGGGNAAPPDVP